MKKIKIKRKDKRKAYDAGFINGVKDNFDIDFFYSNNWKINDCYKNGFNAGRKWKTETINNLLKPIKDPIYDQMDNLIEQDAKDQINKNIKKLYYSEGTNDILKDNLKIQFILNGLGK